MSRVMEKQKELGGLIGQHNKAIAGADLEIEQGEWQISEFG